MKKWTVLLLVLVYILSLSGCGRTMNDIIAHEPSITGLVTKITNDSALIKNESGEYWISLDVENADSMTHFAIGDKIVVYYDGTIAETYPMQINTVYAITLKTPASRITDETDTVVFHDRAFPKSDLSEETLQWLTWYNALTETEQLAISYIPADLHQLLGYGTGEDVPAETE